MNDTATTLETLLTAELETLEALSTALEQEHSALLGNQPADLEAATTAKNAAVEQHRLQQAQRLTWMAQLGLPADMALSELVAHCDAERNAGDLQHRLASLARACQDNNRRNGGLIVRLQEHARSALDVLRREDSADIYSLSGAREHHSDSRTLGKA